MNITDNKIVIILILLSIIYIFNLDPGKAQTNSIINVIPEPASVVSSKGHFIVNDDVQIIVLSNDNDLKDIASYCAEQVKILDNINLSIRTSPKAGKKSIILKTGHANVKKEAYSLIVRKDEIIIDGASPAGLFYGVQTFLQLIYPASEKGRSVSVSCMEINDEPAFIWRGMHLDVSRHFFSIDFVKKMIDMMALQKMNVFHWHLTDDQGWRIEIKKYPKLTEISSYRDETMVGHYTEEGQTFDGIRYGGYYTQDQIRDVVNYAQSKYITIVPEIEMPGHAVAALSAYPQYSCAGGPFKVYTKWGVSDDVFCAGKEETFQFIENILSEVIDLFPGTYIHIGGDECPKTRWKTCTECQKRIKDEGLKDELALQSYFVKRIEKFVASKGKRIVGWDEILEGGLPERATVMSWRGFDGGVEAANLGHDVVMTPVSNCYFDYYQAEHGEPVASGGVLSLSKVYAFNPNPPALSATGMNHILGSEGMVWSEYIPTETHAEYMIFPRLCAMAEVLWSPDIKKDYTSFLIRMLAQQDRFKKYNVKYRLLEK